MTKKEDIPTIGSNVGVKKTLIGHPPPPLIAWTYVICKIFQSEEAIQIQSRVSSMIDTLHIPIEKIAADPQKQSQRQIQMGHCIRTYGRWAHIDSVDIRPLLSINFNAHKSVIHYSGYFLALKAFSLHYMAPVTGTATSLPYLTHSLNRIWHS